MATRGKTMGIFGLGRIGSSLAFRATALGMRVLATEKFPSYRRAYKNLGLVYVRQNRLQEAIAPLSQVVQLGGDVFIGWNKKTQDALLK